MDLANRICQYYENYRLPDIEQFLQENLAQVQLLYPLENQTTFNSFCQFYQKFYHSDFDTNSVDFRLRQYIYCHNGEAGRRAADCILQIRNSLQQS